MKKLGITFVLWVFGAVAGYSQLGTPMLQYSGNQLAYNPGYAGIYDLLAVNLTVHQSWIQLPGAPSMINFNGHAPFRNTKNSWGWTYQREQWGPLTGNFAYGNYAYKIYLRNSVVSLGIQAGFFNHTVNWDKIDYVEDYTDPGWEGYGRTGTTRFDVNVGAYYLAPSWYVGVSAKHLTRPKYDNLTIQETEWYSQMPTQFFMVAGYNIDVNYNWSFRPEIFLRHVKATPLSTNVGMHAHYQNRHSVGINFMPGQKSVSFNAKTMIGERFRIGYAYAVYYSAIKPYQKGSHEILVNYMIPDLWKKDRTVDLLWL